MTAHRKKPARGRPALPDNERRASQLPTVRCTAEDREKADALAKAAGVKLAVWILRRATTTGAAR